MHVLHVTTDLPYRIHGKGVITQGGGGACVAQLIQGLLEKNIEIEVVTSRVDAEDYEELFDIPIYRTSLPNFGFRESRFFHISSATEKTLELVRRKKFDLVHTHNPTAGLTGCLVSKFYRIPHTMTLHGPWAEVRQNTFFRNIGRCIERFTVSNADFVTCDSAALKEDTIKKYRVDERKIKTIQNAVDTNKFSPIIASKKQAREKLGLSVDGKIVLYAGRFVVEKGLPSLLEAAKKVLGREKDVTFVLLGGGFDDEIIKKWLSQNPKFRKNIIVIPYLQYEKMPYAYAASDLFVLSSLAEGMSRSVLEAMSSGLPIVASCVGGNVELVSKKNGILFEPKDSDMMANAIQEIFGNKERMAEMGKNSRKIVEEKFSVEARIDSFLEVYKNLV